MREDIKGILTKMVEKRASDLHITANSPMHYRVDGALVKVTDKELTPEEVRAIISDLAAKEQMEKLERDKELEFSFSIGELARYRVNVFLQRSHMGCAIRMIPYKIMSIAECGLPENIIVQFCKAPKGLVLVTGSTGSGKSTTLAAMVDEINTTKKCHIMTVEDPVEYLHNNKKAVIDQREVYSDTHSFSNALRHVLRQDPDVIMVGELRDLETIRQAMIIADTGHLVLGTLHTPDCIQTINRVVDVFPPHQQQQIRTQFSFVLLGIVGQQLIPRIDQPGLVLATEILIANPALRSMIREKKEHQIYSIIQTAQKLGMQTMNQSLAELYTEGKISYDSAVSRTLQAEELIKLIERR